MILPHFGVSTSTSSSCTKDGTIVSFTFSHRPSRQVAVALTRPEAVSSMTTVSGSFISMMPDSSSAVVTQIEFEPDMACAWSVWRMMKPASASGRFGGTSRLTEPIEPERGSRHRNRRRLSSTVLMWLSCSAIEFPGIFGTPPIATLPISPSQ
ncbi:hypothetical protein D9M72_424090 [compost metagenome]